MAQLPLKLPSDQMQTRWKSLLDPVIKYVNGQSGAPTPSYPFNVVTKSSAYSANVNDYVIAKGASFSISLPDSTKCTGQQIAIQHAGTSLTNVYTLYTQASQTIGGIANGAYALYTTDEALVLISDGSNWQIVTHFAETPFVSYTPTGNFTNTTYLGEWRRSNIYLEGIVFAKATGTPTAESSTTFTLPSPATINTSILPGFSSVNYVVGDPSIYVGQGTYYNVFPYIASGSSNTNTLHLGALTQLTSFTGTQNPYDVDPSTSGPNGGWKVGSYFTAKFRVPINGWQP